MKPSRAKRARGYTVIEVMIAMAILAIGTTGIIAMQKVTAVSNRDAKNLVIANQIARTWMERLRTDAVRWNRPSPSDPTTDDRSDTTWLSSVTGDWFWPKADGTMYPMANALGDDVSKTTDGVFCTNVRLSWMFGPYPAPPPYLLRAEVRVFWLRDGGGGVIESGKDLCDTSISLANVGAAINNYHFVYLTSGIEENVGL